MSPSKQYAEAMKQAFFYTVKKLVLDKIFATIPLFGVGIFNPIISYFVGKLVEILAENGKLLVYFTYIDMRVGAQGDAYEKAAKAYYEAVQKGNDDEIKKAEKLLDKRFDEFVRWSVG